MKRHNKTIVAFDGDKRRGSSLLIVLALLGLLTLLGLIFFTFANQERLSAEYFSEAANNEPDAADDGHQEAIRQILLGAGRNRRNSVLFGRSGIVSNLVGTDSRPNSGTGINIIYWDDPNQAGVQRIPVVDQDRDGQPDAGFPDGRPSQIQLGNMVDSAVAHNGVFRDPNALPAADGGTTYPDQNSPFLSYSGYAYRLAQNGSGNLTPQLIPVIIPSYMRPGLHRTGSENSVTSTNWHGPGNGFGGISFRPHRSHVFVTREGQTLTDPDTGLPYRRFISDAPADMNDVAQLISGPFPFTPPARATGVPVHDNKDGELGIWTATPAEINQAGFDPLVYELDVDTDGDGIADAIWMDLDHPVLEDPASGRKFTYLYAVSIKDLDALLNINVVGNLNGDLSTPNPIGGVDPILGRTGLLSTSDYGMTPSEINPSWALMRNVSTAGGMPPVSGDPRFEQFERTFGKVPQSPYEQANMEWAWLLLGRAELSTGPLPVADSDVEDIFPGRLGEPNRLFNAVTNAMNVAEFFNLAPRPGLALQDDNNDITEGVPGFGMRGLSTPLDFNGTGRWTLATDPRVPMLRSVIDQTSGLMTPVQAQQYFGHSLFSPSNAAALAARLAQVPLGPNQLHYRGEDGVWGTADDLVMSPHFNSLFDDMNEGIVEPERIERPFDEPYTNAESLTLQMTDAFRRLAGDQISDRLLELSPWAFQREDIRQRFTTASWSLREHGISVPFPPGVLTPLGRDGAPGWAGVDDDQDGIMDEFDEIGTWNPATHSRPEDGFRAWLFNADTALFDSANNGALVGNNRAEFPPKFGGAREFSSREFGVVNGAASNSLSATRSTDGIVSEDPFRPQLRRLLRLEVGDQRATFGQLPLNINRFLDVERLPNRSVDLLRGILEYRALTEHVDSRNADGTTATTTLQESSITPSPYPPRDVNGNGSVIDEMEYWARRDRQKMARDIYVLLYTLGGGNDSVNYTASNLNITPGAGGMSPSSARYSFYTPAQLRQMAQFAVNMVDALDRDNVATKFEYDKNLGNTLNDAGDLLHSGWNLDDDASTPDGFTAIPNTFAAIDNANGLIGGYEGNYPEDSFERGVVYGVERKTLAFSEVLAVRTTEKMDDAPSTLYADDDSAHAFLHVELQNVSSEEVAVATSISLNDQNAIYRLRRFNESTTDSLTNNHSTVAFLRDAPAVGAGGTYTIATSAGTDRDATSGDHRPSDLYVDIDGDSRFDRISPAINGDLPIATSTPADSSLQPRSNIDLVHNRDRMAQVFSVNGKGPGADTPGEFLTELRGGEPDAMFDPNGGATSPPNHVLVLERRANPHMPSLPLNENPWIEVDRTYVRFRNFEAEQADDSTILSQRLMDLWSMHRTEPLQAINDPAIPNDLTTGRHANFLTTTGRRNTIGVVNTEGLTGKTGFRLVQTHYDRDFTSLGDLLHIPLFGPDSLTTQLRDSQAVPSSAGSEDQLGRATANTWNGLPGLGANANPPVTAYGRGRAFNQALVSGANAKFLMADFPSTGVTAGQTPFDLDNRWYLMFAALEVTSRTHRQLGNPLLNLRRVPGKINLNTLRHPQILQALLDSPLVADLDLVGTLTENGGQPILPLDPTPLPSQTPGETRGDWMQQFIASRDGEFVPPVGNHQAANGHTLYIPGLPGSRPFHNFGRMSANAFSFANTSLAQDANPSRTVAGFDLEQTLLRALPADLADGDNDGIDDDNSARRLFEVGTAADFEGTGPYSGADTQRMTPQTRHRLLSKLLNNTTTSSNTFVVHMTIGRFEVLEDPATGLVRIGGEYDITPGDGQAASLDRRRHVFLIDRSELGQAFDAGSNTIDHQQLIKQQVSLQ